jgi:hypothetical protein
MGRDQTHLPLRSLRLAEEFADFDAFAGVYSRFTARLQAISIELAESQTRAVGTRHGA